MSRPEEYMSIVINNVVLAPCGAAVDVSDFVDHFSCSSFAHFPKWFGVVVTGVFAQLWSSFNCGRHVDPFSLLTLNTSCWVGSGATSLCSFPENSPVCPDDGLTVARLKG